MFTKIQFPFFCASTEFSHNVGISSFSRYLKAENFTEKAFYEKKKNLYAVATAELRGCLEPQLLRTTENITLIKIRAEEFPAIVVCKELAELGWFAHIKIPLNTESKEIILIFSIEKPQKDDEEGFKHIYIPSADK